MKNKKTMLFMNTAFLVYSLTSVLSKLAAGFDIISLRWIICYAAILFLLMLYAVMWQFSLKKVELITAYSNKAVVVIWGMVWGLLFFQERITFPKIAGISIIIIGILILSRNQVND